MCGGTSKNLPFPFDKKQQCKLPLDAVSAFTIVSFNFLAAGLSAIGSDKLRKICKRWKLTMKNNTLILWHNLFSLHCISMWQTTCRSQFINICIISYVNTHKICILIHWSHEWNCTIEQLYCSIKVSVKKDALKRKRVPFIMLSEVEVELEKNFIDRDISKL